MCIKSCYFTAVLWIICPISLWAQLPLESDNSFTAGKDVFQLEFTNSICLEKCNEGKSQINMTSAVFTYGLFDHSDLIISTMYGIGNIISDCDRIKIKGLMDVGVEFKRKLLEFGLFSSAIKPGISIPSGQHEIGFGSGKIGFSLFSVSTFSFKRISININAGYIRNENIVCECKNLYHFSASGDFSLSENLHFVTNVGLNRSPEPTYNEHPFFTMLGFYYLLGVYNEFCLAFKNETTPNIKGNSIITGYTHRF